MFRKYHVSIRKSRKIADEEEKHKIFIDTRSSKTVLRLNSTQYDPPRKLEVTETVPLGD